MKSLQHCTVKRAGVHSVPEKPEKDIFRVTENFIYTY
jgi:hypothetical protein